MKFIKVFGNTTGLVLLMAIVLMFFSGPTTLFSSLDALLFDAGSRLTSTGDVTDSTALVTLPVTGAKELTLDPSLSGQLIQFLGELKNVGSAAAVFMLDGYPREVVNSGLMQVEEKLEQVLTSADAEDRDDISDLLAYVESASGPGSRLSRALLDNDILVAMKTTPRAASGTDAPPYRTMTAEASGNG